MTCTLTSLECKDVRLPLGSAPWGPAGGEFGPESELLLQSTEEDNN